MEYKEILDRLTEIENHNKYYLTDLKDHETTANVSKRDLTVDDMTLPMTELAYNQLLERNKLRCPAFSDDAYNSDVFNELKEQVLKYTLKNIADKCLIYRNGECINAVLSEKYRIIRPSDLFKNVYDQLVKSYKQVAVTEIHADECYMYITFNVWDRKIQNIQNALGVTMFTPCLEYVLVTSNVGLSGAKLLPMFKYYKDALLKERVTIPLASPIIMDHKGNANAEKFAAKMIDQNKFITETPEVIRNLRNKVVNYPVHCLINVADKIGITAQDLVEVLPMASAEFRASDKVSAFEIYLYLTSVIQDDERYNNMSHKFEIIEKTSKALSILSKSLRDVDIPKIKWVRLKVYADEGQDFIPDNDTVIMPNRQVSFFNVQNKDVI